MHCTFNTLRLFIAGTALLLALLAAPAAHTQSAPPAMPSDCGISLGTFGGPTVSWRDNSANEDGFIVEHWLRGKLVRTMVTAPNVRTVYAELLVGRNRYRVKAFNAFGESAWSNWAEYQKQK